MPTVLRGEAADRSDARGVVGTIAGWRVRFTSVPPVLLRRGGFILRAALVAFLVTYLAALWLLRGDHVAGWELLGPAHGKALVHERGAVGGLVEFWRTSRHFQYWSPINSVPYGFVPGWLSSVVPWLYWAQVCNLVLALVAFLLVSLLPLHRTILWATLAASPTLLSHLIVGYPYSSGSLLYASALLLVWVSRGRRAGLALMWEGAAWLAILELSLHCYELGRTFFVVPALAAVTLSGVAWPRRVLWLAVAVGVTWSALAFGGSGVESITREPLEKLARIPGGAWFLARQLFADWSLDGPALVTLSLLCAVWIRRDRAFWRLGLLAQLGLLLLGAVQFEAVEGFLRPRRALIFLSWSAWMVAWTWQDLEHRRWKQAVVLFLIVLGQGSAVYTTLRFQRERRPELSLPYTHSQVDFLLDAELLDDARRLRQLIELGDERHFIFYGYSSFPENTTDPQAILERLYLQMPDATFRTRVVFVDRVPCRYSCVPHASEGDIPTLLAESAEPFHVHVYREHVYRGGYDRNVTGRFLGASVVQPLATPRLRRFESFVVSEYRATDVVRVDPHGGSLPDAAAPGEPGLCSWKQPEALPVRALIGKSLGEKTRGESRTFAQPLLLEPSEPVLYHFGGFVNNPETRPLRISIEAAVDDELLLLINGQTVIDLQGYRGEQPTQVSVLLPRGLNELQGYYSNLSGIGVLRLDTRLEDGRPLAWSCRASGKTP